MAVMSHAGLLYGVRSVSIFRSVISDPAVSMAVRILERVENGHSELEQNCADMFRMLAESAELSEEPMVGNAWQNHLLSVVLSDGNVLARKAELSGLDGMGPGLLEQARTEMNLLRGLYDLDLNTLLGSFPSLDGFYSLTSAGAESARVEIKRRLDECDDWTGCVPMLVQFYAESGAGDYGRYRAFRWRKGSDGGELRGVASPDSIRLADLVEYEWQREDVRRNTEKLILGLLANNLLLYGDRGTGKSSTVKAMLNEFSRKRLRLVEVAKDDLTDLPTILSILRRRPEKFILFIDDLSFEENETQYKALKAVLEGGLEARPANVALYATSNRRNLIRERFSDRVMEDDEVHPGDTMQEKLSLSDRFGIKIPFLAPDQEEYLRIVTALAGRAGIELTEDLRKKALAWQHARSGRSARQFVDYIIGEQALEK